MCIVLPYADVYIFDKQIIAYVCFISRQACGALYPLERKHLSCDYLFVCFKIPMFCSFYLHFDFCNLVTLSHLPPDFISVCFCMKFHSYLICSFFVYRACTEGGQNLLSCLVILDDNFRFWCIK